MTTFTLDANGAAMAGQGLGNLFRALAVGDMVKNQAQQTQQDRLAQMYLREMQGRKYGAEAQGLEMTNAARQQPIDDSLPERLQLAYRLFNSTGDTNMLNFARAAGELQSQGYVDEARANVGNIDMMNRLNTLAKPGSTYDPAAMALNAARASKENQTVDIRNQALQAIGNPDLMNQLNTLASPGQTYEPFAAVGNTGSVQNKATGEQSVVNDVLAKIYGESQTQKSEGSEGSLTSTVIKTLQIPALDEKGRPVRNPITGELETTTDQGALTDFYAWASQNKRKPTATAFAEWESQGRPGSNKNPPPSAQGSTMEPKIPPGYRQVGTSNGKPVYEAPDGKRYILE